MNIQIIKLASGEELVADVSRIGATDVSIKNPLAIVLSQAQNGQLAHRMIPWCNSTEKGEMELNRNHVLFIAEANKECVEAYTEIFSVVKTPSKKLTLVTP